jgi:hypothetical protein
LHFVYRKEEGDTEEQIYLYVEADDRNVLMKKRLEEVIGVTKDHYFRNHYPYCSWAGDLERQDVWSDSRADIVRPSAKVLNAWYSQLVENRTLRNLNMNIFDSSIEGYSPTTWQPKAWGMYGIPVPTGKRIEDVFHQMPVADLSESLDEMRFVMEMNERATGATSTNQGVKTIGQQTLGEIQLALNESKQRTKSMSKFYTQVWKERGEMFIKLCEAGADKLDAFVSYKKGKNSNDIYSKEISPDDWKANAGYRTKVWSQDEKDTQDLESLQATSLVKQNMSDNPKVDEVFKRKLLERAKFTPDEVNEAMAFEDQKRQALLSMASAGMLPPNQQQQTLPARQPMQQPMIQ